MYGFIVKYYADCDEEVITDTGIVPGDTFGEALQNVLNYFDEKCVEDVQLRYLTDNPILLCPVGIIDVLAEENNV